MSNNCKPGCECRTGGAMPSNSSAELLDTVAKLLQKDGTDDVILEEIREALSAHGYAVEPPPDWMDEDEDDGERLECESCGESFNVNESGSEEYCTSCIENEQCRDCGHPCYHEKDNGGFHTDDYEDEE